MDSSVEAVEKILNYSFANKRLLRDALKDFDPSKFSLCDRLEFLGDSVLGLAFAKHFHCTKPNLEPSILRELRAVNVSNEKFARVALKYKLYQILQPNNFQLSRKIQKFAEAVEKEDYPVPYGGFVKAPKALADILESIAGAVYVDVNFDLQRLWEIFESLMEPIITLEDLQQDPLHILVLCRMAKKHGKRIQFRYWLEDRRKIIAQVYLDDKFISSGKSSYRDEAKLLAAKEALLKLSDECVPIENVDIKDEKGKLINLSTESLQKQTESSSLPTASGNPLTNEMTEKQIVVDKSSLQVEPGDAKGKLFQSCSTRKLLIQTGSSSLPTKSEHPLTYEMTPKQIVVDKGSLQVKPEDAKGKLFEVCSTEKSQLHTGSPSLPTTSELPLTNEMTHKKMVVDEDSLEIEPEDAKRRLVLICTKYKWPKPIFSVEEERMPSNSETGFVSSVKIEIPAVEGTFHIKGEVKSRKKLAENSSAYHMLRALKSSLMSLVIRALELEKSLEKYMHPEGNKRKRRKIT